MKTSFVSAVLSQTAPLTETTLSALIVVSSPTERSVTHTQSGFCEVAQMHQRDSDSLHFFIEKSCMC